MLGGTFEEAREQRLLTGWGECCLGSMVQAALCDLDEQARALLERAHDWLEVAIRDRELPSGVYTKYWSEAQRLHAFGLCRWLKDRTIDRPLFAAACDEIIRFLRKEKDTKTTIAYNLASFILAGRSRRRWTASGPAQKLKPPSKTSGIQCPGRICYLFAMHEQTGDPDRPSLERAFHGFLKKQIPICLNLRSGGFGIDQHVPTWTMLDELYFGGVTANALENIRRARAYLP